MFHLLLIYIASVLTAFNRSLEEANRAFFTVGDSSDSMNSSSDHSSENLLQAAGFEDFLAERIDALFALFENNYDQEQMETLEKIINENYIEILSILQSKIIELYEEGNAVIFNEIITESEDKFSRVFFVIKCLVDLKNTEIEHFMEYKNEIILFLNEVNSLFNSIRSCFKDKNYNNIQEVQDDEEFRALKNRKSQAKNRLLDFLDRHNSLCAETIKREIETYPSDFLFHLAMVPFNECIEYVDFYLEIEHHLLILFEKLVEVL